MKANIPVPSTDPDRRANDDALLAAVNAIGEFIFAGKGAPAFTPTGPALYFRVDGPEVYKFNGAWVIV